MRQAIKRRQVNFDEFFLEELYYRQAGQCAITGLPMTMTLGHGKVPTNASIDRINPSRGYEKSNVQLVCFIVNIMKYNMSMEDLVFWCEAIIRGYEGYDVKKAA